MKSFLYITTSCCVFLYNQMGISNLSGLHAMVLKTKLHLCLCSPVFLLYLSDISHTYTLLLSFLHTLHTLAPVLEEDHFSDTKRAGWKGQMMMTWCKLLQSSHHFHRMAWSINRDALAVPYPAQTWRAVDVQAQWSISIYGLLKSRSSFLADRFYLFLLIYIHLKDMTFLFAKNTILYD